MLSRGVLSPNGDRVDHVLRTSGAFGNEPATSTKASGDTNGAADLCYTLGVALKDAKRRGLLRCLDILLIENRFAEFPKIPQLSVLCLQNFIETCKRE